MPTLLARDKAEILDHPDRIREVIPRHLRAGVLRRIELPDGGIQFVEARTDLVFATFDGRGRFVR